MHLLPIIVAAIVATFSARAAEIPFRFEHGFIWLEVSPRNGSDKLHFILDSGATVSVLNESTCRKLGLKRGASVSVTGVGTRVCGHWPTTLRADLAGVPLPKSYLVLSLAQLSESSGRIVDGLIGADFFKESTIQNANFGFWTNFQLPAAPQRFFRLSQAGTAQFSPASR